MANSVLQGAYFPPLDVCLTGAQRLISWKTAYRALCDPDTAVGNNTLAAFFGDAEIENWLVWNVVAPSMAPASKTRSDFETKTAPIHLSQSANGEYDVDQLKADALWLSDQTKVEELLCLRAVVLEWQSRPAEELLHALADNGEVKSIERLGASTLRLDASTATVPDVGNEDIRRERQLQILLEEKSYLIKTSAHLVNLTAAERVTKAPPVKSWILDIADKVGEGQCHPNNPTAHEAFITTCIAMISKAFDRLSDTSQIPAVYLSTPTHELMYATTTFTDITTSLRLLLATLHLSTATPSQEVVLAWFNLMAKLNFFQEPPSSPALPDPSAIQSLASVISVAILRVKETMLRINSSIPDNIRSGTIQYPTLPTNTLMPYIQNEDCLRQINVILYSAAVRGTTLAGPAMFAWSLITTKIHEIARYLQERRDAQRAIEDESSDGGEPPLLRRRPSREHMSTFEKHFLALQDMELEGDARDDPPAFLARVAVDQMHVCDILSSICAALRTAFEGSPDTWEGEAATSFFGRSTILELLREGLDRIPYCEEILSAILATLSAPGAAWDDSSSKLDRKLAERVVTDTEVFGPAVLQEAFMRSPFEVAPLMRLLAALARASSKDVNGPMDLVSILDTVSGVTVMMSQSFRNYVLENEEEEGNNIALTADLPLFFSKEAKSSFGRGLGGGQGLLTMGNGQDAASRVMFVPAGTKGAVIKETRPLVFRLEYEHSGLEYLGILLSTILPNSDILPAPMETYLDRSAAADVITLINALLKSSLEQNQGQAEAAFVLTRLSNSLSNETDIATVIAEIMEAELLSHLDQSAQDGSHDLLIACADFFSTLLAIVPEKVWSTLNRSSLLGLAEGANGLAAVVSGTEVQLCSFRFLRAVVQIYGNLIDDAIAGLVKRKAKLDKATNRFDSPMSSQDATPERTMSAVLAAAQTVMGDVWFSLSEWRFAVREERCEIATELLLGFERLLKAMYGVGEDKLVEKRITAVLLPAAKGLVDSLVRGDGLGLKSFGTVFAGGVDLERAGPTTVQRLGLVTLVDAAASFLTTLLRTVATLDNGLESAQVLGRHLVQMMPVFAALLAIDHAHKRSVANLLTEIVQAVEKGTTSTDPPSLLGQLSPKAGKAFLGVISQLDQPLRDIAVETSIWNFLSAIMASKQQWFAIYVLTGALPRDRLKEPTRSKKTSLLAHALDHLSAIANLSPERASAMLKFVASAQDAWIWATNEVRSHPNFFKNTLEWLSQLQPTSRSANLAEETLAASEHQMAAYFCKLLAAHVHAGNEIDDKTALKQLLPHLAFLRDHACAVSAYNRSLHLNLATNFATKFSTSALTAADFARTPSNPYSYGRDFHYDLDLADTVLRHEMAWQGTNLRGTQQGFADEFARANVNLSLVEAQKELLQAWRILATTLCGCVTADGGQESRTLEAELAKTTARCLQASVDANLEVPGMDEIVESRAQMAFVVLSKLVGVQAKGEEMKGLVKVVWELVRASPVDFDVASAPEDLGYYRTLLQVLYLAIQPHVYIKDDQQTTVGASRGASASATAEVRMDYLDPSIASSLVEIAAKVIAPSFRALCASLHTSSALAQPADFSLLTALLRAILSVHGVSSVHPQLADIIASSSLVRSTLSLYSWSDRLAATNDNEIDPIYAEAATSFLLALSTLPPIAHQMSLSDDVLPQLASANISNVFRRPSGSGPFDTPRRAFVIWTDTLLPICLNLLSSVGAQAAPDVSAFLNSFPAQLARAEVALENRVPSPRHPYAGAVTLGLVREAHSLVLIAEVIRAARANAAAEGVDGNDLPALYFDGAKVREEAVGLTRQKTSLASRIVAINEREEVWGRVRTVGGAESGLMGRVVRELVAMDGLVGDGDMSAS